MFLYFLLLNYEVNKIIFLAEHISLDEISSDDSVTFMSDEERNKNKPGSLIFNINLLYY